MREGRNLTRITPAGQQVIDRALRILQEAQSIKHLADELQGRGRGALSIGTTHTQARYVLPDVIREFRERYPHVRLHLHQGTSEQIAEMVAARPHRLRDRHRLGAAVRRTSCCCPAIAGIGAVIVPQGPSAGASERSSRFKTLAEYPIVTYTFSFTGPSSLQQTFAKAGLTPNVAITARDADVIKTYVRLGLGVGIVASMAVDPREDDDLVAIDASHLFPAHTTWIGFRRGTLLRGYMYDFLQLLAPHLTRRLVDRAGHAATPADVDALFADVELPVYK